jgi:uncharacterized YccA/Bax inhibitor family protein
MGAFNTGNPTLTEKIFDKSVNDTANSFGTMSIRGTMYKFGFTLLLLIASASYTWSMFASETPDTVNVYMMVGGIGGFVLAMIIIFKPTLAPYLVPAYAIFEGLFIGGISAFFNAVFSEKLDGGEAGGSNIILNAVGLTLGVAIAMFLLYNFRIIKVTDRLRSIVISATMGVALFYLITWILGMFGVDLGFAFGSGLISIGISLFVVGLAAFNLLLDFDSIEKAAEMGAPKYMEWYGAFGLMVTLVWLYLEILRLLSKLNSRD